MTVEDVIRILDTTTSCEALTEILKSGCLPSKYIFEACQLAADELRKRQWISVKDRLPEDENDYLVYFDDGFIAITFYKKNGWELWADGDEPTHWMKLPEPPKEG